MGKAQKGPRQPAGGSVNRLALKIGAGAATMAIGLVIAFEGRVLTVQPDPIGRLAVCYGHDDQTMTLGQKFTPEQCKALLDQDLLKHAEALQCVQAVMTDGQKAAFLSFAYNVGNQAFCRSSLVRYANVGDMRRACAELSRWTLANGRELPGLVKRRAAERKICES
jgi:lysozyme